MPVNSGFQDQGLCNFVSIVVGKCIAVNVDTNASVVKIFSVLIAKTPQWNGRVRILRFDTTSAGGIGKLKFLTAH